MTAMDGTGPTGNSQAEPAAWWHGISRYHLLVFFGCWLGGIFDGMDSTLMSVVLPVSIAELIGTADKGQVSQVGSIVTAVFLLGWMVGGILFGVVGDKMGRVKAMIFSILLYALFTGLAGLTQTWEQLAVCRFLTGLGIGGELVSITTFLAEVWPQRSRALAIGVLITSYQAGVFIAGGVNALVPDWRTTFFIGALPALLVVFLRAALKESDRWMAAREQQLALSEKISHARELFKRENTRSLIIGSLAFGSLLIGYWASLAWIPAWIEQDLLQGTGQGNERGIATMYQGIAAVVGCSMAGLFADWIGRRWTIALSYLGCLGASALLFMTNETFSTTVYLHSALLGYFIGLAQAIMYVYLPELFPTLVRASGTGFCLNAGRFVTAIAVFNVGNLVAFFGNSYAKAAMAFAYAYLIALIAAYLGEETRGKALKN